jgi:multidrug efflux system outer membrane protein
VNAAVTGNRVTTGEGPADQQHLPGRLSVTAFELDLFGRVRNLSEGGAGAVPRHRGSAQDHPDQPDRPVANDLPDLLADEELLALTQQTLKTRDESLRLTQLRFDNGVSSKLDLQQAVSLVEQRPRAELAQQQRQRAQDVNLLTLLVGQPIPDNLPPARPWPRPTCPTCRPACRPTCWPPVRTSARPSSS